MSLRTLNQRIEYLGGTAEGRFQNDKLRTLKKALYLSYQAMTAVLANGNEFRALMNPDKLNPDYDNKILSIPYKDVELKSKKEIETGIKPGDIFTWKETNTRWLVYLENIEEDAYFRAECRKCADEQIDLGGRKYYGYVRGPVEGTIDWHQKSGVVWNTPNNSLIMFIPKDEYSSDYLSRFKKVEFGGKVWEVQVVNTIYGNGIIQVHLLEYYTDKYAGVGEDDPIEPIPESEITGPAQLYPYDIAKYSISSDLVGSWSVDTNKVKIKNVTEDNEAIIEILTGKSGEFNVLYTTEDNNVITYPVVIKSL